MKTICFFGTYIKSYSRNQILLEGLKENGYQIIECHQTLWKDSSDRLAIAKGGWKSIGFIWRFFRCYASLLKKYFEIDDYDVMLVGYPGYFDVFIARILAWLKRKPLVWDVFNSLYLMMRERDIHKTNPHFIKMVRLIEKAACHLPEMLFLDNEVFIEWFKHTHQIDTAKFRVVPIGAFGRFFYPFIDQKLSATPFRAVYYGSFIPNHGVHFIIEAAKLLENERNINFEFIGEGPEKESAQNLAKKLDLQNITFTGWLMWQDLREHLKHASVVLGAFGTSEQLQLTNNNKVFEGLAMAKPVITGASKALPRDLKHGENILLCECGNAQSLADAILRLSKDTLLQEKLGQNGRIVFENHYDIIPIGQICKKYLNELNV